MGRRIDQASARRPMTPASNNSQDADELLSMLMNQGSTGPKEQRIVLLHGDVNEYSISQTIGQLLWLASADTDAPISLVISTYGGSVDEMFSLYDTMCFLPCPVNTIALGKVMSAGVLLLAAGEKGSRLIGRSSRVMMHGLRGGVEGNIFEMINDVDESKRQQELIIDSLAAETKMSRKKISEVMSMKHDHYLSAEEAVKFGIADKLIGR